jgi:hypothetical protein
MATTYSAVGSGAVFGALDYYTKITVSFYNHAVRFKRE